MRKKTEYRQFEKLAAKLLAVPHAEIQQKLDSEKEAKKRRKSKRSSASREGA